MENRHGDSLKRGQVTLSQGKMKKGDNVIDNEDDDVVKTSASQDQVTTTLCTEVLFLSTQYIQYSSLHTPDRSNVGKEDMHGQHDTFNGPS